ncbi:MAG: hypothetical protein C0403_15575, partial [Desulfobacterium sp.]|nr:hypothetical protein [Desulfobacterium sp.]
KTIGNLSFKSAWVLGSICEKLLTPVGIRPPITRLAAAIMGKNNNVDAGRAKEELGWSTRIPQDQAMKEIHEWVLESYRIPGKRR